MRNIKHLYGCLVPQSLTWSFCVKSEVKLVGLILRLVPLVFGHLSASVVKVSYGYVRNVRRLYKSRGPRGLALYLKTCYILLQQGAGGMKSRSPMELGANVSRTRSGIPRIINPQHRSLIIKGDVTLIRFWLSLFGLYRVIEFKGALKLKTITEPGKDLGSVMVTWDEWVPDFFSRASKITKLEWKLDPSRHLTPNFIPFIRKSSPNSSGLTSVMALPIDIALFWSNVNMRAALLGWLKRTDGLEFTWALKAIWKLLDSLAERARQRYLEESIGSKWWTQLDASMRTHKGECQFDFSPLWYRWLDQSSHNKEDWYLRSYWGQACFGKLGFKEEPGKIRVFAMVTALTQTLMYPLHKWIFSRLRQLPTDGTFNQVAPVERLLKRKPSGWYASYDLSAATDRLPLQLQRSLLRYLIGPEMDALWAQLLVGEPYHLPRIAKSYNLGFSSVRYAVGQPMGALSSWAMLALTHHAIIQFAASVALPQETRWFQDYAILGDDIVIANEAVAAEYLAFMEKIGVEISQAKSLISSTASLEFAKRTWIQGREVSPISLAEMLVSLRHLMSLEELVRKNLKYNKIKFSSVARFAGFGYKNLAQLPVVLGLNNRLSGCFAYLCRPGGVWALPFEGWLSALAPGRTGGLVDTRAWIVSEIAWKLIYTRLIKRLAKVENLLMRISLHTFVETDKPSSKKAKSLGREPVYSASARKYFGMDTPGGSAMWNEFFIEWVSRPFATSLRPTFERCDSILRRISPDHLPSWNDLGEIWTSMVESEDSVSTLPTVVEFASHENEEKVLSTQLITLWRRLRKIALREVKPATNLRTGTRIRYQPYRRPGG